MKDKICYVFGAGEYFGPLPTPAEDDFVIAVDGGFAQLREAQIPTDLIVGDFDSLGTPPASENAVILPREKDDTDMFVALQSGYARGYRSFYIYGGTGGRFDHTMANIQCLSYLAKLGARGYLFGESTITTALLGGSIRFPASAAGTLSVFALDNEVTGVYETGLRYGLDNATVHNSHPIGISNEFVGTESEIRVGAGTLLVIYPDSVQALVDSSDFRSHG